MVNDKEVQMCDVVAWLLAAMMRVEWLSVANAVAALVTAAIAYAALQNWKRQDGAKRKADFLDELIESTNQFMAECSKPLTLLSLSMLGVKSYGEAALGANDEEKVISGAIAYIKQSGKREADDLQSALDAAMPSAARLRSLAVKGGIFEFERYKECEDAIKTLTWQLERMSVLAALLNPVPSWNWENPKVRELVKKVSELDSQQIYNDARTCSITLTTFASGAYKQIYG
ncbi:hypothetical protein [Pandoraea sp. ISTKB]|uniref:hypothetical protein n=1 Tax=Pandoraea sp. ISTKB TaxID=1586708 RepID=UPI001112D3DF|nr:hypothetical protein [Pandoraea sp. ISTKB]